MHNKLFIFFNIYTKSKFINFIDLNIYNLEYIRNINFTDINAYNYLYEFILITGGGHLECDSILMIKILSLI